MKNLLIRLVPGVLALCLCLSACGGGGETAAKNYDPAATAQALLDSRAFTDTLDTLDKDTAAAMYGIDASTITDSAVYTSLSMGAEEIAVLTLTDEAAAKTAKEALDKRVSDQIEALKSYMPAEVDKLNHAIVEQSGNTALLVVAADAAAAQKVLDGLN